MIHQFSGKTADDAWINAAEVFSSGDGVSYQHSPKGNVKELLHSVFTIENPRQRWVSSRVPAINPAFALAEVVWIMNGMDDADFLNFWNPKLPQFCGKDDNYYGSYGFRLKNNFGIDQLNQAYDTLKNNPNSRQVVLSIWDPNKDLPEDSGKPKSLDIPCNVMCMLKVRDGKLDWTQINRSNDLFLGCPHNFVQFTYLQEIMAGWLGIEVGVYTHFSDSLHVYEAHYQSVDNSVLVSSPYMSDILNLDKKNSDYWFKEIKEKGYQLIKAEKEDEIINLSSLYNAPESYNNLYIVLAADAALRKGFELLSNRIIASCTNNCFRELWYKWRDRFLN